MEVEVEVEVRDWQIKAFPKRHAQNDEQTLIEITSRFYWLPDNCDWHLKFEERSRDLQNNLRTSKMGVEKVQKRCKLREKLAQKIF